MARCYDGNVDLLDGGKLRDAIFDLVQAAGNKVAKGLAEGALQSGRWIFGYEEQRAHGMQLCEGRRTSCHLHPQHRFLEVFLS